MTDSDSLPNNTTAKNTFGIPSLEVVPLHDAPSDQESFLSFLTVFGIKNNYGEETAFTEDYIERLSTTMMLARRMSIHSTGVITQELNDQYPTFALPLLAEATKDEWLTFQIKAREGEYVNYSDYRLRCTAALLAAADKLTDDAALIGRMGFLQLEDNGAQKAVAYARTPNDGANFVLLPMDIARYKSVRLGPQVENTVRNAFGLLMRFEELAKSLASTPWVRS